MNANVRGKVVEWVSTDMFKVEFIDFGFVDTFAGNEIKIIDKEFLKLPPFAIECCLKEYEGVETVAECEMKKFERKCREIPEFDMRVVKRDGNRYIVEVEDMTSGAQNTSQRENLNRSDWSEANTTITTHFTKRRTLKRRLEDGSDDEDIAWEDLVVNDKNSSDSK